MVGECSCPITALFGLVAFFLILAIGQPNNLKTDASDLWAATSLFFPPPLCPKDSCLLEQVSILPCYSSNRSSNSCYCNNFPDFLSPVSQHYKPWCSQTGLQSGCVTLTGLPGTHPKILTYQNCYHTNHNWDHNITFHEWLWLTHATVGECM